MSALIIEVFPDEKEHEPASTTYWRRQAAEKDVLIRSMREALEAGAKAMAQHGCGFGTCYVCEAEKLARVALAQVSASPWSKSRLLELAEAEDGCDVSVGGLAVDMGFDVSASPKDPA